MKRLLLLTVLAGCASGPRPVPQSATAAERLSHAESALLGGKNLTGSFELDSKGQNTAHLTGTLAIARMGLLHNLVMLAMDQPIEKSEGGYDEWVKALEPKDGATESFNGQSCRRVDYVLQVEGKRMGEASLCIADGTGLPLQRTQTVHFETGEMTVNETFKWQMK